MIEEDIQLLEHLPPSFPKLPFFRHEKTCGRSRAGAPFGDHFLYDWWKRACKNLGIEDVDLYGGTRHSSASNRSRGKNLYFNKFKMLPIIVSKIELKALKNDIEIQTVTYPVIAYVSDCLNEFRNA
ncbi:MAG: hypothetical protein AB7U29_20105 [Desulfobulbus sp.]